MAEDIANGQTVGITASASDADATTNTVTYAITAQSCEGALQISDSSTGVVTVANTNALDYDTSQTCTVTIRATSADNSNADATFTLTLTDVDEVDIGATSDSDATANTVAENAADNTAVGITASATDADATDDTTYSMVIDTAGCSGYFDIGSSDGIVRVDGSGEMNYESVQSCQVTVTSTSDDGSTSTKAFTIALTDHDEFDVTTPTDSDNTANTVAESIANGQTVGITAAASDADGTTNTVTYTVHSQSCSGALQISDGSTGVVTVADTSALDREAGETCTVTTVSYTHLTLPTKCWV